MSGESEQWIVGQVMRLWGVNVVCALSKRQSVVQDGCGSRGSDDMVSRVVANGIKLRVVEDVLTRASSGSI